MRFRPLIPSPASRSRRAISPRGRREAARRRQAAARLGLEALEDRCLLSFSPTANYPAGATPQAVVVADFNNDALSDLAVANGAAGTVGVLLGKSDGTFQPVQNSPASGGPISLAVGDFDADGNDDLVTANGYSSVSVLLGRGDGTFQPPTNIDAGYGVSAQSVAVGDFNTDGTLDLGILLNVPVYGYYGFYGYYGYATVLMGTGSGTFSPIGGSYLGGGFHTAAVAADLNGDHALDLATATDSGTVDVALGSGTGAIAYSATLYTGAYAYVGSLTASDLNNDGNVDLTTMSSGTQAATVLLGAGAGSFGSPQSYAAGESPQGLATADFNGDGRIDLITTNPGTNTVSVLLGTGTGAFKPPVNAAVGQTPLGVTVGDFNGDGRIDAATANFGSNDVSVLLNNGAWPALAVPTLTINDVSLTEGNTGTISATFKVSLSTVATGTVSVHYATADGSATAADGDYQARDGTLSFPRGVTSRTVTVLVNGDRRAETDEWFQLLLTAPTNAFVTDAKGVGSIVDDEPYVSLDSSPVYVTEGNTGTTSAVFTVRLSNAYDAPVDVNFSTAEGDTEWWWDGWYYPPLAATSDSDFQAASSTLTFAPGETVKTIAVAIIGDRLAEENEYFSVDLTGTNGAFISWGHAVGVIVDDEPRVSIRDATATEGNAGTTVMTFTVELSAATDSPVTVTYATSDGGASAAAGDYQATSGTLTFGAGETSRTITVLVNGDRLGEGDEYLYANLTGATGALVGNGFAYGTIVDDEPYINITGGSITEGNQGTKLLIFTVTLSVAYDQTVTVDYATNDWTAMAGEDYVATSGRLTFAPGETVKTFAVTINGDRKKEADETFFVSLSDASSNAIIWYYEDTGIILNDDRGGRPRVR